MESVRAPPLPRPASGQVAVTTGTQVRLPLLRDGFWQLHFHPGQLPAKPAQGPWVESRWLHGLSAACPPLLPHSMADKNGALKCTFSAPGHSTSLLQGLAALRAQGQLLDVVLTVNRETFHAHKVVLAACSDYFRCARALGWSGGTARPRGTIPGLYLQLHPAQDGFEGKRLRFAHLWV